MCQGYESVTAGVTKRVTNVTKKRDAPAQPVTKQRDVTKTVTQPMVGSKGMAAAEAEIEMQRAEIKQLKKELAKAGPLVTEVIKQREEIERLKRELAAKPERKPRAQSDAERAAKYRAKAKQANLKAMSATQDFKG